MVLVRTYTDDDKEMTMEQWTTLCETGVPAMRWDEDRYIPNKWWRTFYVKDAYGNVWTDFCERTWIEYCNDGIPLCRSDDGKSWSANPSWVKNVYWD